MSREMVPFDVESVRGHPLVQGILEHPTLDRKAKVKMLQELSGVRATRQKYGSVAEKKAAQTKRAKDRRESRNAPLYALGVKTKRGTKLSPAEKLERKLDRRAKRKEERGNLRKLAMEHPDLASKYGINISRFRIKVPKAKMVGKKKKK